jgi:hypothetical protein
MSIPKIRILTKSGARTGDIINTLKAVRQVARRKTGAKPMLITVNLSLYSGCVTSSSRKKKKQYPLRWVVESLLEEPSYLEKPMFGCLAVYMHGRLSLLLTSSEEPWNGLLIPTEHQFHESIRKDYKDVKQHTVLKKWLYLPEASESFESVASDIVEAIRMNDQRFGVEPKERVSKRRIRK